MRTLKIMVLLIVVLSGCSPKHVIRRKEELSERNILASWDKLDCGIVNRDKQGFSLGVRVRDFEIVRRHIRIKEIYKYGFGNEEGNPFLTFGGLVLGCAGCILGYQDGLSRDEDYVPSLLVPSPSDKGCQTACLWALPGCLLMGNEYGKGREYSKVVPDFISIDTVCTDSISLSVAEIEVMLGESNFKRMYYTDKDGNIELNFDEIIPEPTEADSIINLIIRYYELVDTVEVRRL